MNTSQKNTKEEVEKALAEHLAEIGKKRGWMPSATKLVVIGSGIAVALLASWLTGCGGSLHWDNPDYGSIVIKPPVINANEGK